MNFSSQSYIGMNESLEKKSCLGIFCKTVDSSFIEIASHADLDFCIIDIEHGPANHETIINHIRSLKGSSTSSIVRVSSLNHHLIGSVLDWGADGVQIPNISTSQQAELAVSSARFFPLGERGVCRFVRSAEFGIKDKNQYFADENLKTLILQVEGTEGVANIDSILKVPGFDVIFIGPYDLSQSVGCPGEIESPKVECMVREIIDAAKLYKKHVGIFCDSFKMLTKYKSMGIRYLSYSVDVSIFAKGLSQITNGFKDVSS